MTAPALYLHLPGTAAEALEFYQGVFGGETSTATYAEFGRTDGPGSAVAHGTLSGAVDLYVSDAGEHDEPFSARGLMVALLGAAEPTTLRTPREATWSTRCSGATGALPTARSATATGCCG